MTRWDAGLVVVFGGGFTAAILAIALGSESTAILGGWAAAGLGAALGILYVHSWLAVRSSLRQLRVLRLLASDPMDSLAVRDATGYGHAVYPILHRLERAGLLRTWETEGGAERGGRPRIWYAATPEGRAALAAGR
jgi:hypothetical protein